MSILRLEGVEKRFGKVQALRGTSFEVGADGMTCLVGPNGAGKTTLFDVVLGLQRASAGRAWVLDHEATGRPHPPTQQRVGFMPQNAALHGHRTALDTLRYHAGFYPHARDPHDLLDLVGLTDRSDRPVQALSGGEHRRVALACALVHDPELLILDEPTAALDPLSRQQTWTALETLHAAGTKVVFSTHLLEEAERHAQDVVFLHQGRVLAHAPPADLVRAHAHRTVVAFGLGREHGEQLHADGLQVVTQPQRVTVQADDDEDLERAVTHFERHGARFLVQPPNLESAFLALATSEGT